MSVFFDAVTTNWPVWFVTFVLVVAAVIDGAILRVPNWLTFPFIISGWCYGLFAAGLIGLGHSWWEHSSV